MFYFFIAAIACSWFVGEYILSKDLRDDNIIYRFFESIFIGLVPTLSALMVLGIGVASFIFTFGSVC